MATYADRVFTALGRFHTSLASFADVVATRPPDPPRLPKKALRDLEDLAATATAAHDALAVSIGHIANERGVDLVDMQVRLKGEAARLADALRRIGDAVAEQHFVREAFSRHLVALHESAQLVAAALFPSAVQGLREANVALWQFQRLQRHEYGEIMARVARAQTLSRDDQRVVEDVAVRINAAFEAVNTLLNELADSRATDARRLRARLATMTAGLSETIGEAEGLLTDDLKMFRSVVRDARKTAAEVEKHLRRIVVPILPAHDGLGPLEAAIDGTLYEGLGGVQVFALLNIGARLLATLAKGRPLLHPDYGIRVTEVFPDRVYFRAAKALVEAAVAETATFKGAPASLHKFNDGSVKQYKYPKGNLQLCYEWGADHAMVDADMDKYRAPIPHLLGEVLVNHLTGGKTDQFDIHDILRAQDVAPIRGFSVLTGDEALA